MLKIYPHNSLRQSYLDGVDLNNSKTSASPQLTDLLSILISLGQKSELLTLQRRILSGIPIELLISFIPKNSSCLKWKRKNPILVFLTSVMSTLNCVPILTLTEPSKKKNNYNNSKHRSHNKKLPTLNADDENNQDVDELKEDQEPILHILDVTSDAFYTLDNYLIKNWSDELGLPEVVFPLVELKTKQLSKIDEVLKYHCGGIKMQNGFLTNIISATLFDKLESLVLQDYENFELVQKLRFKELTIVGSEIESESIHMLINSVPTLAIINYEDRVVSSSEDIVGFSSATGKYDLILVDYFDRDHIYSLNPLNFHTLSLNLVHEANSLNGLDFNYIFSAMNNLKKLYLNCILNTTIISPIIDTKSYPNGSIIELAFTRGSFTDCDFSGLSKLQSVTMLQCEVQASVLNTLKDSKTLEELTLINCNISWVCELQLPKSVTSVVISNEVFEDLRDISCFAYSTGPVSNFSRSLLLNLNSVKFDFVLPKDIALCICKLNSRVLPLVELPESVNSIDICTLPNYSSQDLSKLQLETYPSLKKIFVTLLAFGNTFYKPTNIPGSIPTISYQYVNYNYLDDSMLNKNSAVSYTPDEVLVSEENHLFSGHNSNDSMSSEGEEEEEEEKYSDKNTENKNHSTRITKLEKSTAAFKLVPPKKYVRDRRSIVEKRGLKTTYLEEEKKQTTLIKNVISSKHIKPAENPRDPSKPFECEFCVKAFGRKEHLRRHSLTHTNYRPHVCEKCNRGFRRSDNLKNHQLRCFASGDSTGTGYTLKYDPYRLDGSIIEKIKSLEHQKNVKMVDIDENDIKEALQPEVSADGNRIRFVQMSSQIPNNPVDPHSTPQASPPKAASLGEPLTQSPSTESQSIENVVVKQEAVGSHGSELNVETTPFEKSNEQDIPDVAQFNNGKDREDVDNSVKSSAVSDALKSKKRKHEEVKQEEVKQEEIRTSKRGRTIKAPQKYEIPLPEVSTRRGTMKGRLGRPPKNNSASGDAEPERPKRKYTRKVNLQKESGNDDVDNEVDDFDIDAAMTKAGFSDSDDKIATKNRVRKEVTEFFNTCVQKDGAYECIVCSKVFTKRGNLKRHLVGHCDTNLFSCPCGRSFKRTDNLKQHQLSCRVSKRVLEKSTFSEGENPDGEKSTDGKRKSVGRPKGKTTKSSGAPKKVYKRKPITERNFHCTDCGKSFKRKYHLKRHLLIHENEQSKPFICSTCGLGFKRPDLLENHNEKNNCYASRTEYSDSDHSTGNSDSEEDTESESEEE
ncbi:unnamed protein product [Ambrosiozyma monospora]|uniref:Unnamed protein product n=1 Tax=Ambrosiozyma monospora TaxID=43982 RepID=A0A9W7DGI6_AMBMO|nr:unnamed protein product [Ambrosiozyma monospora]